MRMLFSVVFLLAALGPLGGVAGQEVTDTSLITISGTVFNNLDYAPILGASLRFSSTEFAAETAEGGQFTLGGLSIGTYLLVVSANGFQELRITLDIQRTGTLHIPLEPLTEEVRRRTRTNRVIGQIRESESSQPVEGAEVTLTGVQGFQISGSDGRFEFPLVPQGFTTLSIRRMGREPMTDELEVSGVETLELDIRLGPNPVAMEPMVITVTRLNPYLEEMGYYDRVEKGYSGQYIDRAYIEERNPSSLTDIFQVMPGVRVNYNGLGEYQVLMSRAVRFSGGDGCVPAVFIDDVPSDAGWLQDIQPFRIAAMEVYSGVNAPLRYNDPCGVVLVWTRRGDHGG